MDKITPADKEADPVTATGHFHTRYSPRGHFDLQKKCEERSVTRRLKLKGKEASIVPKGVCELSHLSLFVSDRVHLCFCADTLYAHNVCVGPHVSLSALAAMCVLPAEHVCTRLRSEPRGGPDNTISVEPEPCGSIQRGGGEAGTAQHADLLKEGGTSCAVTVG